MAEINITPLTDCFLVLLIIFMVGTTVMSQSGVDVNLPTASPQSTQNLPEGVVVTLLSGGQIRVGSERVRPGDWDHFRSVLNAAWPLAKSKLVILEGDRKVWLGSAIELMDEARRAGAESFAIATQPEPPSE